MRQLCERIATRLSRGLSAKPPAQDFAPTHASRPDFQSDLSVILRLLVVTQGFTFKAEEGRFALRVITESWGSDARRFSNSRFAF
jgi:hypothetical protein